MDDITIVEVNIYGRMLSIKSPESNAEYLKEVAEFVNESMNDIADLLKREMANNKAGKDTLLALKESIASRSNELIRLIDETKESKEANKENE